MVANDVSQAETGFDVPENEATLLYPDGTARTLPRMSKEKLAAIIIGSVPLLQGR
jgi:phosphopantothenoylcysteine synthetase/decarboxylase